MLHDLDKKFLWSPLGLVQSKMNLEREVPVITITFTNGILL